MLYSSQTEKRKAMQVDLQKCMKVAKYAVKEAGKIIKELQPASKTTIKYKENKSPVTDADKKAEQKIRAIIAKNFPLHGIIGEEFPPLRGRSNYTWIGDAIDGTWSYSNGEKTVATSLALCVKKHAAWNVLLSIIYNPLTNEMYTAGEGFHPTMNSKLLKNQAENKSEKTVINFQITRNNQQDIAKLYQLWQNKKIDKLISTGGSISYSFAKVAEGVQSSYILAAKNPLDVWDSLAGVYLVKSVGGEVTTVNGKEFEQEKKPQILVASKNRDHHQHVLSLLDSINFGKC
jgi:fructose-1,6-bisphosphatase/inositol monophosphatase family enzyme